MTLPLNFSSDCIVLVYPTCTSIILLRLLAESFKFLIFALYILNVPSKKKFQLLKKNERLVQIF